MSRFSDALSAFEGQHTIGSSSRFWGGFVAAVLLVLSYPLIAGTYSVIQTTVFLIWIFVALSLTLIWGYTGIFSFGQNAFFGIGGYLFAVIGGNLIEITGATNIAFLVAILAPALFGALLGYFMFYGRVSGVYVAIITLSMTLILELIASSTTGVAVGSVTLGGYNGVNTVPDLAFGFGEATISFGPVSMYYLVAVLLIVLYLALRYVLNSDIGYVLVAIREDESRTEMFGYDVRKIKLQVFTVSGAIAGLGGALYTAWGNFISPPVMGILAAALPLIWVTVGGRKTLLGAVLGAFSLQYLDATLASSVNSDYAVIILGVIFLVAILALPNGVVPRVMRFLDSWADERDHDQAPPQRGSVKTIDGEED
ncbi:ABC transporter permease subunit [Halobellus sp. GM3]|uniref:ABC transporter permease subunit n=1 Tax=Halobellus sp. GM3 TaxID=3458410 RepID=UPI00403DB3B2